jgi:hypothetical protein
LQNTLQETLPQSFSLTNSALLRCADEKDFWRMYHMKGTLSLIAFALSVGISVPFTAAAFQLNDAPAARYQVLPPTSQGNLTVFPIVSPTSHDTTLFLTLDEGTRSGEVIVTESGQSTGLVRPRASLSDGIWRERPFPIPIPPGGARVNELSLINNSTRPLLLLAGEIVTGGKQDRVVGKDRIIPAHSLPVALGVFCVEPHRWTETSANFSSLRSSMAQPSVRSKAMADQNQQQVWNEVAKSRRAFIAALPQTEAQSLQTLSSYASAMQSDSVQGELDKIAKPLQQSYETLIQKLRAENAVGAVVAVNGEIVWADVFASSDLLNRFWAKLIRSYAAESLGELEPVARKLWPTQRSAQQFLDRLGATHESVDTEPGLYRNTEITGEGYSAFILTALLPGTGFNVHLAKMKR